LEVWDKDLSSGNSGSLPIKFTEGDVQEALNVLVDLMPEPDNKAKWKAKGWSKIPGKDRVYINKDGVSVGFFNARTTEFTHVPEGWDKLKYDTRTVIKETLKAGLE
jgi:hypothetical protein